MAAIFVATSVTASLLGAAQVHAPAARSGAPAMQLGNFKDAFKVQKSERLLIREAWERADAYRPGKANWFTQQQKDLVDLHNTLLPELDALPPSGPPGIPGAGNVTSLIGALLKSLTTGDLALTLCSKEPPVLTELRDWLITALTMPEAVCGLPEEQGRVLSTLARAVDARKMIDIGTFTGYSSIAMALATADDAKVICCEPDANYARHARDWWMKAGCANKMEMHVRACPGPPSPNPPTRALPSPHQCSPRPAPRLPHVQEIDGETLMSNLLADGGKGQYDMIFVDAGNRDRYGAMHELAMQLVHVGGVVVYYDTLWPADRVLQHSFYPEMRAFNARLAQDPRVLASLVPLSYGITVAMKAMDLDGPALEAARGAMDAGSGDAQMKAMLSQRREAALAELQAMGSAGQ